MSTGGMSGIPHEASKTQEAFKNIAADTLAELNAERETAKEAMLAGLEQQAPYRKAQLNKKIDKKALAGKVNRGIMADKKDSLKASQQIQDKAENFASRTKGELKRETLLLLREQIAPDMSSEDIIEKVQSFTEQKDPFLIAETLEFLEETTEGALGNEARKARQEYEEQHKREIAAAKNTREVVYEKEIGEYKDIRALYYDLIRNPRQNSGELFIELSKVYSDIDKQNVVLDCLFHSAGADLRAQGPSIEPGLLVAIQSTIRSLQAIRGTYNFFSGRMPLVKKKFAAEGQRLPSSLTFVKLAEQFIILSKDQYPSSSKVLGLASSLGVANNVTGQITLFEQMRDAVRQVSRDKIFHSIQHRDEVLEAIILALEELEDKAAMLEGEAVEENKEWEQVLNDDQPPKLRGE